MAATGLLLAQAREERVNLEVALANTARALSLAVDREVRSYVVLLRTLGETQSLRDGDLARFHDITSRVARQNDATFISLFSRDGRQLLNTARPYGEPLPQPFSLPHAQKSAPGEPPLADTSSLRRVMETGQPSNSNLYRSLSTGKLLVSVEVPVLRDGVVAYVINIAFESAALQALLGSPAQSEGALGVIIDANDFVLARWDGKSSTIGKLANPDYRAARAAAPSFVTTGTTREGRPVIFAGHTSTYTGWTSVASAAGEHLDAQVRRIWLVGVLMTLAGLLGGVALAYYLGRRINASLQSLVHVAAGADKDDENTIQAEELIALREALLRARRTEREAAAQRERAAAAQARQAELEQSAEEKDRFIATLSHELRNPLGVIRNAVLLLRHGEMNEKTVAILERQTDHLTRLIDDLLDLSRLAQDKIRLVNEVLDLRQLVSESVEMVEPRIVRRGQRLAIKQPGGAVLVSGDRVRLRQVIANLIDNAAKYSPQGSAIGVDLEAAGAQALLIVRDEGPGIDAAHMESVFEPFMQLPDPREQATDGLGLGLPLARQHVRLHGGTIELHNRPSGGLQVEVRLPLKPSPVPPAAAA
jgi:signal transduction histidine kinase